MSVNHWRWLAPGGYQRRPVRLDESGYAIPSSLEERLRFKPRRVEERSPPRGGEPGEPEEVAS